VLKQEGPVLVMDGERLFGQFALRLAIDQAAVVAKQHGVCILTLRQTHHVGRVGAYAEHAASMGLASIFFANINDHAPLVAPFGGSEARGSTNPIALGIPRPNLPTSAGNPGDVILDFATSVWPLGKARVAFNRLESLPDDVAIDPQGNACTDPAVMFPGVARGGAYTLGMKDKSSMGALTAFGKHKGAGLNLFCELFAALAGGGTSAVTSPQNPEVGRQNGTINNVFCVLIDPSSLAADRWKEEVDTMASYWVSSKPAPGVKSVLLPGDAERQSMSSRLGNGIPLESVTWEALLKLAEGKITPPPSVPQAPVLTDSKQQKTSSSMHLAIAFVAVFAAGFALGRHRQC